MRIHISSINLKRIALLSAIILNSALNAFGQEFTKEIPDLFWLQPFTSHHILPNNGQLVDDNLDAVPDVQYYTFSSIINHYFLHDKFTVGMPVYKDSIPKDTPVSPIDSMYRTDFLFEG